MYYEGVKQWKRIGITTAQTRDILSISIIAEHLVGEKEVRIAIEKSANEFATEG